MADPQTNTESEKTTPRETAKTPQGGLGAERRSFEQAGVAIEQGAKKGAAEARDLAASTMEGARQVADTGRRAGQLAVDAWSRSLDPFFALQMDANRWFDDAWRQLTGLGAHAPLRTARPFAPMGAGSLFGQPPADLRETEKAYHIDLELPGLTRENIDVSVRGDALLIRGHKTEEHDDTSTSYRVSERRFGRFERAFPIPDDVNRTAIDASFRDGVLRISLPKSEAGASPSRIEIRG